MSLDAMIDVIFGIVIGVFVGYILCGFLSLNDKQLSSTEIRKMGYELNTVKANIIDKKILFGFNMAIAIVKKHLKGDQDDEDKT